MAINKELKQGMTPDPQVKELQKFLNDLGPEYQVAASGPGSPGNETENFGPLTVIALQKYQKKLAELDPEKYGSLLTSGYGQVGPVTLGSIQSFFGTGTGTKETDKTTVGGINPSDPKGTTELTDEEKEAAVIKAIKEIYPEYDDVLAKSLWRASTGYIPPGSTDTAIPQLPDYGTPEWDAAVAKVEASYYDVANKLSQANTDSDKAIANYNWKKTQEFAKDALGIALSDNALAAWDQLQAYKAEMGGRGLSGSGIEAETFDNYLKRVRAKDDINRRQSAKDLDLKEMAYYSGSASAAEIADLIKRDPKKAQDYGLIPSAEQKASFTIEALKAQFPGAKEEDLINARNQVFDENGNFRSTLYKNQYTNIFNNLNSKKEAQVADLVYTNQQEREKAQLPLQQSTDSTKPDTYGKVTSDGKVTPDLGTPEVRTNMAGMVQGSNGIYTESLTGGGSRSWYPKGGFVDTPTGKQYQTSYTTIKPEATSAASDAAKNLGTTGSTPAKPPSTTPTTPTTPVLKVGLTSPAPTRDYSSMKPTETMDSYYKRLGIK